MEAPIIYDAIQWDGTLDGAMEVFKFVSKRTGRGSNENVKFQTRVYGPDEEVPEGTITLDIAVIPLECENDRRLWSTMWLVYNTRSQEFFLQGDSFHTNFTQVEDS